MASQPGKMVSPQTLSTLFSALPSVSLKPYPTERAELCPRGNTAGRCGEGLKDGLWEVPKGDKWSRRHFSSLGNACLHLKGISCDQAMQIGYKTPLPPAFSNMQSFSSLFSS
jgi:hypothetical protein